MVSTNGNNDTMDQDIQAIHEQIGSCTRDIGDLDAPKVNATGVLIKIGDKYFVATVAHFLNSKHRVELVRHKDEEYGVTEFAAREWSDYLDVGFLELRNDHSIKEDNFLHGKRILTVFDQTKEWDVAVSGYPSKVHVQCGQILGSLLMHYDSNVISTERWPDNSDLDTEFPLAKGRDILVDYRKETDAQFVGPDEPLDSNKARNIASPEPGGMSGGGIWLLAAEQSEDTGLRVPAARLMGIQKGYFRQSSILRGTMIGSWLTLVEDKYPDLREEISAIRENRLPEELSTKYSTQQ